MNIRNVTSNFTNHSIGFLIFTCVKILKTFIVSSRVCLFIILQEMDYPRLVERIMKLAVSTQIRAQAQKTGMPLSVLGV